MTTEMKQVTVQVVTPEEEGVEKGLILGAHAPLQAVYEAAAVPSLLHYTLSGPVTWQIRNENTVISAVHSPNLAPQFVAALLAWGARVLFDDEVGPILSEAEGTLADYLRGTLPHKDRFSAIRLPLAVHGRTWGESHVARTPADAPIVAAIAVVDLNDDSAGELRPVVRQSRLAITGVWREHTRLAESASLLVGGTLTDSRIQQVAAAVEQEVSPHDDYLGSADYRRSMAAVLAWRALADCMKGAKRA